MKRATHPPGEGRGETSASPRVFRDRAWPRALAIAAFDDGTVPHVEDLADGAVGRVLLGGSLALLGDGRGWHRGAARDEEDQAEEPGHGPMQR